VGPRHALTGAVLVVGAAALAGCGALLLRADLTTGTRVAALALWLLAALAVGTLTAFVREVERHHRATQGARRARPGRRADLRSISKPLPGLVLLWVGGLTALAAFPFMLSSSAGGKSSAPQPEVGANLVATTGTESTSPVSSRSSSTSVSRSTRRPRPTVTTAATPAPASTTPTSSSTASRPRTTTSTTSTTTPSTTTTTNPGGITITLLPKPTKPKG
jgi:hypothetical protein